MLKLTDSQLRTLAQSALTTNTDVWGLHVAKSSYEYKIATGNWDWSDDMGTARDMILKYGLVTLDGLNDAEQSVKTAMHVYKRLADNLRNSRIPANAKAKIDELGDIQHQLARLNKAAEAFENSNGTVLSNIRELDGTINLDASSFQTRISNKISSLTQQRRAALEHLDNVLSIQQRQALSAIFDSIEDIPRATSRNVSSLLVRKISSTLSRGSYQFNKIFTMTLEEAGKAAKILSFAVAIWAIVDAAESQDSSTIAVASLSLVSATIDLIALGAELAGLSTLGAVSGAAAAIIGAVAVVVEIILRVEERRKRYEEYVKKIKAYYAHKQSEFLEAVGPLAGVVETAYVANEEDFTYDSMGLISDTRFDATITMNNNGHATLQSATHPYFFDLPVFYMAGGDQVAPLGISCELMSRYPSIQTIANGPNPNIYSHYWTHYTPNHKVRIEINSPKQNNILVNGYNTSELHLVMTRQGSNVVEIANDVRFGVASAVRFPTISSNHHSILCLTHLADDFKKICFEPSHMGYVLLKMYRRPAGGQTTRDHAYTGPQAPDMFSSANPGMSQLEVHNMGTLVLDNGYESEIEVTGSQNDPMIFKFVENRASMRVLSAQFVYDPSAYGNQDEIASYYTVLTESRSAVYFNVKLMLSDANTRSTYFSWDYNSKKFYLGRNKHSVIDFSRATVIKTFTLTVVNPSTGTRFENVFERFNVHIPDPHTQTTHLHPLLSAGHSDPSINKSNLSKFFDLQSGSLSLKADSSKSVRWWVDDKLLGLGLFRTWMFNEVVGRPVTNPIHPGYTYRAMAPKVGNSYPFLVSSSSFKAWEQAGGDELYFLFLENDAIYFIVDINQQDQSDIQYKSLMLFHDLRRVTVDGNMEYGLVNSLTNPTFMKKYEKGSSNTINGSLKVDLNGLPSGTSKIYFYLKFLEHPFLLTNVSLELRRV